MSEQSIPIRTYESTLPPLGEPHVDARYGGENIAMRVGPETKEVRRALQTIGRTLWVGRDGQKIDIIDALFSVLDEIGDGDDEYTVSPCLAHFNRIKAILRPEKEAISNGDVYLRFKYGRRLIRVLPPEKSSYSYVASFRQIMDHLLPNT